jgi:cyclophilin family peptidyl-prolyl cis-trans isomerase
MLSTRIRLSVLFSLAMLLVLAAACVPPTGAPNAGDAGTAVAAIASAMPPSLSLASPVAPSATTSKPVAAASAPAAAAAGSKAVTPAPAAAAADKPVPTPPADNSRPLAKLSPAERSNRFTGPAAKSIKPNTAYLATIVTTKGNIVAELYQDTPEGANNFVTLAQNGFYDGLTFHRVEPKFVIQGGDPLGNGQGGPGYTIPAEINHPHILGALAWARTGDQVNPQRRSSGSQFYITLAPVAQLDGAYSVFGAVIQGLDVLPNIVVGDKITRIDISEAKASQLPTPASVSSTAPTSPAPSASSTPVPTPYAPTSQQGRPLAQLAPEKRENLFNQAPAMTINATKKYEATIKTAKGNVVITLDPAAAPIAVNNFVMLANLGYYDKMPVAHAEPDQYVVLGSPNKRPDSDVGYMLEPDANVGGSLPAGAVSYYPAIDENGVSPHSSGGQFLITFAEVPPTDAVLSQMGTVTAGLDIAKALLADDPIETITITEK